MMQSQLGKDHLWMIRLLTKITFDLGVKIKANLKIITLFAQQVRQQTQ